MQTSPAVHFAVQSSRQRTLHSVTLVHVALQRGLVPHWTSQLVPPVHAQSEPLHTHVAPAHVGEALGPHAAAKPATESTTTKMRAATFTARTLSCRVSLRPKWRVP